MHFVIKQQGTGAPCPRLTAEASWRMLGHQNGLAALPFVLRLDRLGGGLLVSELIESVRA
jgi:hypothetical protein